MGVYKELQKHFGSSTQNYIIAARTTQGYEDWKSSSRDDRLEVVARWHSVQTEIEKERQQVRQIGNHAPRGFLRTRHLSFDERKQIARNKKTLKKEQHNRKKAEPLIGSAMSSIRSRHAQSPSTITTSDSAAFEEAIKTSIAATSRGNLEQDRLIERAIRASVSELHSAAKEGDVDQAMQRAIQASIDEAARARKDNELHEKDHEDQLKAALHRSISMHEPADVGKVSHSLSILDFDDSGIDTEDDENMRIAIERSKT